jgi:cell division protein FtsW (lipid II flippase)
MGILASLMTLILLEIDMGNTALIGGTAVTVMFVAGASLRWMGTLIAVGLAGGVFGWIYLA